ncbi:hypothetical protein ACJ5H2_14560 [Nocardioides sp. R1-1]|uniref:hypothetical protein n=1 Tax=Nocardioides sp. R1-1 TaxID=3383502 RepID=UPI0038CFD881
MRRRRPDQRGASAVVVAVLMAGVLVVSAAFAVDLGQQRVVRRDMQAVADLVALDLARTLQAKPVSAYSSAEQAQMDQAFAKSVRRNTSALGGALDPTKPGEVDWQFVVRDGAGWKKIDKWTSAAVPDGVRVVAHSDTAAAFGGITGTARMEASRPAVATMEPQLCFSVGTNLVDLDTSSNVVVQALKKFVGIDLVTLSLSAVGPSGIADLKSATVPLVGLAAALNVGSVNALLTTPTPISVGQLLTAMVTVLDGQRNEDGSKDLAAANVAVLLRELLKVDKLTTPTVKVADILAVAPGTASALDASISVADFLNVFAYVAGKNALGVTAPISLPGIGNAVADVKVIEIPRPACARPSDNPKTVATSAQVQASAVVDLAATTLVTDLLTGLNNLLTSLLGGLLSTREERIKPGSMAASLVVKANSAQPTASLKVPGGIRCTDAANQSATLDVTTSLANVTVDLRLQYQVERRTRATILSPWSAWTTITTVNSNLLTLGANLGDSGSVPVELVFPPPPDKTLPSATKSTALSLSLAVTAGQETAIGGIVGSLLNPVMSHLVNPLVPLLNSGLLPAVRTLLGALGVELGRTTVMATGRPVCLPRLVG